MVALSTVICNKNAKIIFARQFTKMSRLDLEEHIVHFSRNLETCKETTHLESDKARFLFIPIDNLFLVLITSKQSNIIEDTEIIKLIYRLIQDLCGTINEINITLHSFELTMGIDDIVFMGYRNSVSLGQVRQFMLMESQEEKEFKKKQEERENLAKKQMIEKMKEIDKLKRENKYHTDAISSSSLDNNMKFNDKFDLITSEPIIKTTQVESVSSVTREESPVKESNKAKTKGMKLTKKKKTEDDEAF